jgi:DNA-binding MarR family transcriptional regulator
MDYNTSMAITDLQHNINWLLMRASFIVKQRLIKISEDYDLSPMQALTLCLLEPGEPVPMSTISDLLACDASNVTGIVERLTVGSYIERKELSTDRRVKTICLTRDGVSLRNKLVPRITELNTANLEKLSAAEIETLKEILQKTLPIATSKHLQHGKAS